MTMAMTLTSWQTGSKAEDLAMVCFSIAQDGARYSDSRSYSNDVGATYGVRSRALSQASKIRRLVLIAAPASTMALSWARCHGDTSGSRLRPTDMHLNTIWEAQNARRGVLLRRRLSNSLSPADRQELSRLQEIAEARAAALARHGMTLVQELPPAPHDIDRIIEPPSDA